MDLEEAGRGSGCGVALVVGGSSVVFAIASAVAASGYPSRMWLFVAGGLVLPPVVALTAGLVWGTGRMRTGRASRGRARGVAGPAPSGRS